MDGGVPARLTDDVGPDRVIWVDIVKAMAITLVVFAHCINNRPGAAYYVPALSEVNDMLRLLRMPLFFFVAGSFIDRSLPLPWPAFIDKKLLPALWLYVFWATMRFGLTVFPFELRQGRVDLSPWLHMFSHPLPTLWFVYALFIVFVAARALRGVPLPLLLVLTGVLYAISVSSGQLRGMGLPERIIRFAPFFVLGRMAFGWVQAQRHRVRAVHLLFVPAFVVFALVVIATPLRRIAPATFALSLIGMAAGISVAMLLSRLRWASSIALLGRHSIDVYVLHFLPVFVLEQLFRDMTFIDTTLRVLLIWLPSVALALYGGLLIRRVVGAWPFDAPRWLVLPAWRGASLVSRDAT
jgi:uncharacterized membrane protein YcfT